MRRGRASVPFVEHEAVEMTGMASAAPRAVGEARSACRFLADADELGRARASNERA